MKEIIVYILALAFHTVSCKILTTCKFRTGLHWQNYFPIFDESLWSSVHVWFLQVVEDRLTNLQTQTRREEQDVNWTQVCTWPLTHWLILIGCMFVKRLFLRSINWGFRIWWRRIVDCWGTWTWWSCFVVSKRRIKYLFSVYITKTLFSLKDKGMFLYTCSTVSSSLDCSKFFRLHPLADLFIPAPTWLLWESF